MARQATVSGLLIIMAASVPIWGQPIADETATLEFLQRTCEANLSRLNRGRIEADVSVSSYQPNEQEPRQQRVQVTGLFKGPNSRLHWKGQWMGISEQVMVYTQEDCKEHIPGDTQAYIRDPDAWKTAMCNQFLPSKNPAFDFGKVVKNMTDKDGKSICSHKITRGNLDGREVYILEATWDEHPGSVDRYYIDPAQGAAIVKWEVYTDFGKGPILTVQFTASMRSTDEGVWYLNDSKRTDYRRDGSLWMVETVQVQKSDFVSDVSDAEFTWEGMGLPEGTRIVDTRLAGLEYRYGVPPVDEKIVKDILHQPLVLEASHQPTPEHAVEVGQTSALPPVPSREAANPGPPVDRRRMHIAGMAIVGSGLAVALLLAWRLTRHRERGRP